MVTTSSPLGFDPKVAGVPLIFSDVTWRKKSRSNRGRASVVLAVMVVVSAAAVLLSNIRERRRMSDSPGFGAPVRNVAAADQRADNTTRLPIPATEQ
ncbi:MAG: hypothetical protein DLM59_00180 [Pseudonocardiales bacterium]|nr:MAG: hypothetical protein DLM59_00180 [Pseudonocardiales bacterium]